MTRNPLLIIWQAKNMKFGRWRMIKKRKDKQSIILKNINPHFDIQEHIRFRVQDKRKGIDTRKPIKQISIQTNI